MAGNLPDLFHGVGDFLRNPFRQGERSPVGGSLRRVVYQTPAAILFYLHAAASDAPADFAFGGGYDSASDEADAARALVAKGEVLPVESRHFHSVVVHERDSHAIRQRNGIRHLVKGACRSRVACSGRVSRRDGYRGALGKLSGASAVFLKCLLQFFAVSG